MSNVSSIKRKPVLNKKNTVVNRLRKMLYDGLFCQTKISTFLNISFFTTVYTYCACHMMSIKIEFGLVSCLKMIVLLMFRNVTSFHAYTP